MEIRNGKWPFYSLVYAVIFYIALIFILFSITHEQTGIFDTIEIWTIYISFVFHREK